jgi:hypothetical protein
MMNLGLCFTVPVGRNPWTGDQPVSRPQPTQNTRRQTSMPRVGLEPMTTAFERAKTVHALDRAATAIGVRLDTNSSGYRTFSTHCGFIAASPFSSAKPHKKSHVPSIVVRIVNAAECSPLRQGGNRRQGVTFVIEKKMLN